EQSLGDHRPVPRAELRMRPEEVVQQGVGGACRLPGFVDDGGQHVDLRTGDAHEILCSVLDADLVDVQCCEAAAELLARVDAQAQRQVAVFGRHPQVDPGLAII